MDRVKGEAECRVVLLHSGMHQRERLQSVRAFKSGKANVMVSTLGNVVKPKQVKNTHIIEVACVDSLRNPCC